MKLLHKTDQTPTKKRDWRLLATSRRMRYGLSLVLVLGAMTCLIVGPRAMAAACPAPTTDLGQDTLTLAIPAAATYTVWTRMQAPDTSHNSIRLQVGSDKCYNVGGGTFTSNTWASDSSNWISYSDGSTANKITVALPQGNVQLKYIGTQAGVMIDKVLLTSDTGCVPVGAGGCPGTGGGGDTTQPVVNLLKPTAGSTLTGTQTFQASATDNSGTVSSVSYKVGSMIAGTSTTGPSYTVSWNSAALANGSYQVTATATDPSGNSKVSAPVSVTVTNSGGGGLKSGDLNGDGKVNINDLSIVLYNWSKTGRSRAQGDLNGDGKVNINDLSIVLYNWGK